jgi:hypothetical protein
VIYAATAASVGDTPPGTKWATPSVSEQGGLLWNTGTSYNIGDVVSHGGVIYTALTSNSAKQPDTNPSDWKAPAFQEIGGKEWVSGTSYVVGDIITESGKVYSCATANSDAAFTVANWDIITIPDGTATDQMLSWNGTSWVTITKPTGTTNLSLTTSATDNKIFSDTGTDVTLTEAVLGGTPKAGLMTPAMLTALNGKIDTITGGTLTTATESPTGTVKIDVALDLDEITDVSGTPTDKQVLTFDNGTSKWIPQTPAVTNLSNTPTTTTVEVKSSTGSNTAIPSATTSLAGVMSKDDKVKLDKTVTSTTSGNEVRIPEIVKIRQADYDALGTGRPNKLYIIVN